MTTVAAATVVTVVATTVVAAMTDLPPPAAEGVSLSAAERLAALRTPSKQRGRPALAAKVLAAGLSTTAMLGLVTAMGWPADAPTGQNTAASTTPPTAPATTVAPLVPATTLPGAQPTTVPPVTVPAAIPVDQVPVQVAAGGTDSNITTKTSG
jgi:hypothetical protein